MSDVKKNEIIEIDITDINNFGCGVGRLDDGRVVFVSGAVTGERARAKIIKVTKSFLVAHLDEILKRSDMRFDGDDCKARNSCGGCSFRHIKYENEKQIKKSYVKHAFIKVGLPNVEVNDVHSTERIFGYRNKAQYPFVKTKNGVEAGFYARKSHSVAPASSCLLQPSVFGDILRDVCHFANENEWSVYDEESERGLLRHLYIRIGQETSEIMLCLVINGDKLPHESEFVSFITEKYPSIVSLQINKNKKNTNVVLGKEYRVLFGKSYIEDILCGLRFRITPESFYQVNHDGAELLYRLAREKALWGESGSIDVVDMYCGTGTIGLSFADAASSLVGVEIVEGAVECARINAEINNVKNASFYAVDASDIRRVFESVESERGALSPDVVILDPPRKGCTPEVIEFIAERGIRKVVYVSCDPDTLARDCVLFRELGYEIGAVDPVDMFPRTSHVESVVCLTRRLDNELPMA